MQEEVRMNTLEQFFIDRNSAKSTQDHYRASVKQYEELNGLTLDELIIEADKQEEDGLRWKHRKIKSRLIDFRNWLYQNKSQGTARQYLNDIKTIYRHYEIELHDLPSYTSKQIDQTYEMRFEDVLTKEELIDAYYEANNVVKCIILFASSSGLSKVDLLNLTVGDFIEACDCKNNELFEQLEEIKSNKKLIPCFQGNRQKTAKSYTTFCSPEATQHIVQYLIGRNSQIQLAYEKGDSIDCQLKYDDKLFDISNSHLSYTLKLINLKLGFGKVGKSTKFRCHALRKWQATMLLNIQNGFSVQEIDKLQGRSQDKTHRAYFHNDRETLYEKYLACVDELMLFESIHTIDAAEVEQLKVENKTYKNRLEEQQKTINQIIQNQRELEKLLGLGE